MTEDVRPICHACHLPVREDEMSITHEGHTFHVRCSPKPEIAGEKDDPYPPVIGI